MAASEFVIFRSSSMPVKQLVIKRLANGETKILIRGSVKEKDIILLSEVTQTYERY